MKFIKENPLIVKTAGIILLTVITYGSIILSAKYTYGLTFFLILPLMPVTRAVFSELLWDYKTAKKSNLIY